MPFSYLNTGGIGDGAWSTGVTVPSTLFPTAGFNAIGNGEQLLQDQIFGHTSAVPASTNAYLGNVGHNSGLNSNAFRPPTAALYFPGSSSDISWGEHQSHQSAGPLLANFYQPPPVPTTLEQGGLNAIRVNIDSLNGSELPSNVESSLSSLTIGRDDKGNEASENQVKHSQPGPVASSGSVTDSKPKSWAAIASQPAKPKPKPAPAKPKLPPAPSAAQPSAPKAEAGAWGKSGGNKPPAGRGARTRPTGTPLAGAVGSGETIPVLEKLKAKNNYNPREFSLDQRNARFFIIKSYSEDDIHRSIKYGVWTSTEHGNRRLDEAFKEQNRGTKGPIYLIFSVNGSGHFCGIALMTSEADFETETGIWTQDKWKGKFGVKWLYVKDVPNNALRHIRLENNDNKPVTNSRDTQEVPADKAKQVLKIIHSYKHQTSIFDDFGHYERRQEDEFRKVGILPLSPTISIQCAHTKTHCACSKRPRVPAIALQTLIRVRSTRTSSQMTGLQQGKFTHSAFYSGFFFLFVCSPES